MRETENKLCTLFDKYEKLPLISFLIETGDQMQSKESLSYPNLRKGLLSTYISTLQPYLQIDTEYILYPTYYSRKNNQNLLYRKDTEFQYIYNIKRKNKKVLIMILVYQYVIDTHGMKINAVILFPVNSVFEAL